MGLFAVLVRGVRHDVTTILGAMSHRSAVARTCLPGLTPVVLFVAARVLAMETTGRSPTASSDQCDTTADRLSAFACAVAGLGCTAHLLRLLSRAKVRLTPVAAVCECGSPRGNHASNSLEQLPVPSG